MNFNRRQFLGSAAALVATSTFHGSAATALPNRRRIAIEEHFLTPQLLEQWQKLLGANRRVDSGFTALYRPLLKGGSNNPLVRRLLDLGDERIAAMDRAGITMQVLSLASPGIQVLDTRQAIDAARYSNDFLATAIQRAPKGRYAGFGCCAPQDPDAAAREIERCARELGFVGMLINSHTQNQYLDAARFEPIFAALQQLELPLYLHPQTPSAQMLEPYADYGLSGPAWGFAAETGLHAARIIYSGLLTRFPKVKIILGHLGEGLPWWLARMDSRIAITATIAGKRGMAQRLPSEVFKENFYVTTSGMIEPLHLRFALEVLGAQRVLFATDYPYEAMEPAVELLEQASLSATERDSLLHLNATKLLHLQPVQNS